jgi:hypothetical protein
MKAEDVKLGQKLRVTANYSARFDNPESSLRGQIGTVVDVRSDESFGRPGLEFEALEYGHSAGGKATSGHGWYVEVDYLEPVEPEYADYGTLFPADAKARKEIPLASGVLDYFTSALIEVAKVSFAGNQQHNPGEPLHWSRGKSTDQADTLLRHFVERGTMDTDGVRHSAKLAWRALALLQLELEAEGAPKARGAK